MDSAQMRPNHLASENVEGVGTPGCMDTHPEDTGVKTCPNPEGHFGNEADEAQTKNSTSRSAERSFQTEEGHIERMDHQMWNSTRPDLELPTVLTTTQPH